MSLATAPALYNPLIATDADFVAGFVARGQELDTLLRRLRATDPENPAEHHIILGARGMGKTSLLRRLAIAVNAEADLATRFVPLRFREEQYNVLHPGDFWRNCGEALAEWAEANGLTALADRLDREVFGQEWKEDDAAAARFAAEMTGLERRAVLFVDNLDIVLDAMSEAERWSLRRCFQARRGPVVIGAATRPLSDAADRAMPFYEFFQPHQLEPLSASATEACMRAVAHQRGDAGRRVLAVLASQPERLKTLHALGGGNPRVLSFVYRLLESEETREAMADLELLLDQVTPYFKARVEEYQTAQQRAVIDAIALHWDPITVGDLSRVTGIPTTTLSPLLIKLRHEGLIEAVQTSRAVAGHQLVERLLNIWYMMRHGTRRVKQKMRWLVKFLEVFYSPPELDRMVTDARATGAVERWHPDYRYAVEEAWRSIGLSAGHGVSNVGESDLILRDFREATRLLQLGDHKSAETLFAAIDARFSDHNDRFSLAAYVVAFVSKAFILVTQDRPDKAVAVYDTVISRFGEATGLPQSASVAISLLGKGFALGIQGRSEEEIAAYDTLVNRFGKSTDLPILKLVAMGLCFKGTRLGTLGRSDEAIIAYDSSIFLFGDAADFPEQKLVAKALLGKGYNLSAIERWDEAIAAYDTLLARFGDATDIFVCKQVAKALVGKGTSLGAVERWDDAITSVDTLLDRFGDATDPALQKQVAFSLFCKGVSLGALGRTGEAIAVMDMLMARLGDTSDVRLRELAGRALTYKGVSLGALGQLDKEIAVYDELLARFGDATDPSLRELAARALIYKGVSLGALGQFEEEIALLDALLARFGDATDPSLRELAARALIYKGISLGALGQFENEIAVYDALLARFGDATDPSLREHVAQAHLNKALGLGMLDRSEEELSAYNVLLARFGNSTDPTVRRFVASAEIRVANRLMEISGDLSHAETLLRNAAVEKHLLASANLAWLLLLDDRDHEAATLMPALHDLPRTGRALLEAGLALAKENLGTAIEHLSIALTENLEGGGFSFTDDLYRLFRLADQTGHGERLLAWLEASSFADRFAPIVVAFRAYVLGERTLLDVNPETRAPAEVIYRRLSAHRRQAGNSTTQAAPPKRGRGRPRKKA